MYILAPCEEHYTIKEGFFHFFDNIIFNSLKLAHTMENYI